MNGPRYQWGARSLGRLATCHPALRALFERVILRPDLPSDLTVLCGFRGKPEQDAAFAAGTSRLRWPQSKHNAQPSRAVDVAPLVGGAVTWDWPAYHAFAPLVKAEWAAMQREGLFPGFRLVWGGDWVRFPDGPHWEIAE